MTCDEFRRAWPAYLANELSSDDADALEAHAKRCQDCRACWEDHLEVSKHLNAMICMKSPSDLAEVVERDLPTIARTPTASSGNETMSNSTSSPNASNPQHQRTAVIAGVLFGILLGIIGTMVFGQSRSQTGISRLIELEMMRGRSTSRASQRAMMQAMMGGGNGVFGGGPMSSLPALTGATKTTLCLLLIAGIARTKLWESYAGKPLPSSVRFARAISLLVIILGIALVSVSLYIHVIKVPAMVTYGGGDSDDVAWLMTANSAAMELWSLACWLTVALAIAGVIQVAVRRVSQSPS